MMIPANRESESSLGRDRQQGNISCSGLGRSLTTWTWRMLPPRFGQNVADPKGHQVLERLEEWFGGVRPVGRVLAGGHERCLTCMAAPHRELPTSIVHRSERSGCDVLRTWLPGGSLLASQSEGRAKFFSWVK